MPGVNGQHQCLIPGATLHDPMFYDYCLECKYTDPNDQTTAYCAPVRGSCKVVS